MQAAKEMLGGLRRRFERPATAEGLMFDVEKAVETEVRSVQAGTIENDREKLIEVQADNFYRQWGIHRDVGRLAARTELEYNDRLLGEVVAGEGLTDYSLKKIVEYYTILERNSALRFDPEKIGQLRRELDVKIFTDPNDPAIVSKIAGLYENTFGLPEESLVEAAESYSQAGLAVCVIIGAIVPESGNRPTNDELIHKIANQTRVFYTKVNEVIAAEYPSNGGL